MEIRPKLFLNMHFANGLSTCCTLLMVVLSCFTSTSSAPPRMAADPIGGPILTAAYLAAPKWRRTKGRRGRIGGVEMAAYDLAAETIGGAELTAPNWRRAEMAARKRKRKKKRRKIHN